MAESYDVIIIGSGPGGYVTAVRSAQLGFKTAIVEREHLGGICLNWGCIPTKALLRSAEILHYAEHAKAYGLKIDGTVSADVKAVVDRSRGVSARLNGGVGFLMKKNKVDVIWGEAKLSKPGEIIVSKSSKKPMEPQHPAPKNTKGEGTYTAKHIILATGARPRALPGIEPDGKLIWTYFEAMVPKEMPKSLLVMGSGAIGIEFASFYRTMGADVTVVELLPAVMPVEDAEVSAFARKQFEKQGMKIHLEAKVIKVEKGADSVTAHVEMKDGKVEKITAGAHDLGGRRAGQHRESRPGSAWCEDGPRLCRGGRLRKNQRAGPIRHRRRCRSAHACPQGGTRGCHLRGKDRQFWRRPCARQVENPRLHLLQPAGRVGRPH